MKIRIKHTPQSGNYSLVLNFLIVVICIIATISPIQAQKTVNQKGRVREIEYSKDAKTVPVENVLIALKGGITTTSKKDGTFFLPVTEFSPFNIETIDPPYQGKYSLIVPSRIDLYKPFQYTPNLFEIILSSEEKRINEEKRIIKNYQKRYNDEKASLEKQIAELKIDLEYSQSESDSVKQTLIQAIDSLENILERIPKKFNIKIIQDEVERLVSIDYALLTTEEAKKIDLRKEGDWVKFQELARKNLVSDSVMDLMVQKDLRLNANITALLDSAAQNKAIIKMGIRAYRDMFDSYANMHNCDSAIYYINKLFMYPEYPDYVFIDDYITCSNYIFKQISDKNRAKEIIEIGIKRYVESNDLDSEIRLLVTLADLEYQSGQIHSAYAIFNDVEKKLNQLNPSGKQTHWYANNRMGDFYVNIGEIKKGFELLEYCKSTFQDYNIPELDSYEFLSNYISSLISIGRYSEADQAVEYLLSQLAPLTTNIFYNELFAETICHKANIQSKKGLFKESIDNCNLAITAYNDIFGKSSKAEDRPRIMIADYQFLTGKFIEANESLDSLARIIVSSYDEPWVALIPVELKRAEFRYNLAQFEEAEKIYREQIKVLAKYFQNQPINATEAYIGLSKIYLDRGNIQEALKILNDCDSLIQKTFPQDGLFRVSTLSQIAQVKYATQEFAEAITLLEKAKSITQETIGDQSIVYQNLCVELASNKRALGFYDEANSLLSAARKYCESLPKEIKDMPLQYKNEEIILLSDLGDYDEMRSKIEVILREATSIYGKEHPITLSILSLLAKYYENIGEIDNAIELHNKCIELKLKHFQNIDFIVSSNYQALRELYSYVGNFNRAKDCAEEVYKSFKNVFGEESARTLEAKLDYISLNSEIYDYKNRIASIDQMLSTLDNMGNINPLTATRILLWKGSLLLENGHYNDALQVYNTTLELNSNLYKHKSPHIIPVLTGMAQCYFALLNYKESTCLYEEAISIASDIYGEDNIYFSQLAIDYSGFLGNTGQHSDALRVAEKAHKVIEQANNSQLLIKSMLNISLICREREDYINALKYIDSALKLHLSIYKNENFRTIPIYKAYADFYQSFQNFEKALEYYDKANYLADLFCSSNDDIVLQISLGKINTLVTFCRITEAHTQVENLLTKLPEILGDSITPNFKNIAIYRTIANAYKAMGENKKAIDILNNLYMQISSISGFEMLASQIKWSIADNECDIKDYSSALDNILIAESIALKLNSPVLLRFMKQGHAYTLIALGRYDEAYDILNDYRIEILNEPQNLNGSLIAICNTLSSIYEAKMDKENAVRFREISKEYYKKTMGENSPHYIRLEFESIINGESSSSYASNLQRISMLLNTIDSISGEESLISKMFHFQAALYQFCQEGSIFAEKNLKISFEAYEAELKALPNRLIEIYLQMANAYQGFTRIEESRAYLTKSQNIIDDISDNDSYLYHSLKFQYSKNLIALGKFNEAESIIKKCKEYVYSKYGENSPALLPLLDREIELYLSIFEQSKIASDLERAENAIEQYESIISSASFVSPIFESKIYYYRGLLYYKGGMPTLADLYFEKYKEYIIAQFGDNSPLLISYYNFHANNILQEKDASRDFNKLAEAEKIADNILKMTNESFRLDAYAIMNAYNIQANVKYRKYILTQDATYLTEAITLLDKCLDIINNYMGDSPAKYNVLSSKYQAYLALGDFETAENILEMQYDLSAKLWGEESYYSYSTKSSYGYLCMMKGEPENAVDIYHEVLEFLNKQNSYESEKISVSYMHAKALFDSGENSEAKIQLEKTLKLIEDSIDPDWYNQVKSEIQQLLNSI